MALRALNLPQVFIGVVGVVLVGKVEEEDENIKTIM